MESKRRKPEILAPAGSMEALHAAVYAGADAVYLGGDKFGARAYADNFDKLSLITAIEYCHMYGVKVYLTINTLFRNEEIAILYDYLRPLYEAGLDAVIVQDLGVMAYVHSCFPDLPIHASTQMTITTKYAYSFLKDYGVTRIIPARELSLSEISSLKDNDKPEIEVFVQGALCYCYSGACLMSSMIGGRSGNRGRCAQTCRLPYEAYDGEEMVQSDGVYLLSPKDLCGLDSVEELIAAGVDSFKIEGRMKRPEYVAVCVAAYRAVVDAFFVGSLTEELILSHKKKMTEVYNRGGFTNGYYRQHNGKNMMSMVNPGNAGVVIGEISALSHSGIYVLLSESVNMGDILKTENGRKEVTLTCNAEGKKGDKIYLNVPKECRPVKGQKVVRMFEKPLMEQLQEYIVRERPVGVTGEAYLVTGKEAQLKLIAEISGKQIKIIAKGDIVEPARSNPVSEEIVRQKLLQTGNTRYYFTKLDCEVSEDAFYGIKALKDLRREAFFLFEEAVFSLFRRKSVEKPMSDTESVYKKEIKPRKEKGIISVAVSSKEQYDIVCSRRIADELYLELQHFSLQELTAILRDSIIKTQKPHYVVLPPILRERELNEIGQLLAAVTEQGLALEGLVLRNIDEFAYLHSITYQGKIITDSGFYVMNDYAAGVIRSVCPDAVITVPAELNRGQLSFLKENVSDVQVVGYGYQQLMVSAQCLQKNIRGCNRGNHWISLKDRYHKEFFVKCNCKYCYNLIYNGVPTVLYDVLKEWDQTGLGIRLHFTMEKQGEVLKVLSAFERTEPPAVEFTRGHYNRGVE